ncbi:MAG: hypothetical protein JWO31_3447 [Phycisphaerales bacterium]|nr:hypothetical protein [Phycisphaerales bacterium]
MLYRTRRASRMKNGIAALAVALAALTGGAGCGGSGPEHEVPAVFRDYPRSAALDEVIQTHVDAGTDREDRAVLTTWFQDGDPRVARFCSVRPSGKCSTYQYVYQTEFRAPASRQLTADTVRAIVDAARQLPPTQRPVLANMLIISYRLNGLWQTRLYDRTNRPPAASTIFEVTGAPIVP